MRKILVLTLFGLWSCTTAPKRAPEPAPDRESSLLAPSEIRNILGNSDRTYRVRANHPISPQPLSYLLFGDPGPNGHRLDPFLEVGREEDRLKLRSSPPPKALEPLFERASRAFAARDYEVASNLYMEAVQQSPAYFKSYTYLGNSLFFMGRYIEAESSFRRALILNRFDYQAYLFLGDTLHQLGDYGRSKEVLTMAFMLNQANEVIKERLRTTLAKLELALRPRRLSPPIRIESVSDKETIIYLDNQVGAKWFGLASCLSCWQHEPACRDRATRTDDPLRLAMYRECLLTHVAALAASKVQLDSDDRALLAAVEDGYLEAIVFWEVVAPRAPAIMLLLPEPIRADVLEYIDRYVYVSTRFALEPSQGSAHAMR